MKRAVGALVTIVFVVGLYYMLGLSEFLTLEMVKEKKDMLLSFVENAPVVSALIFAGIYFLTVVMSLPFAAALSLLAGFLFGVAFGSILVVSVASLGALCIFIFARFFFGEIFLEKYGKHITRINNAMSENGFFAILFLRLVPLFPFFLVNIAPAFTRIKTRDFFLATLVGIIPGSIVYVNAGKQLGDIMSVRDIFSPQLLGAFALLGVLALLPALYKFLRKKRAQEKTHL